MSYVYLGATNEPQYYALANKMKWANKDLKNLHRTMKKMDVDWRMMLSKLPIDILDVFDKKLTESVRSIIKYPLPVAADVAVFLELTAAGLPLDTSSKNIAAFMRDRCIGAAGLMGTAGAVATGLAFASAPLALADFGLSAGAMTSLAIALGSSTAVMAGLAAIFDALSKGKSPDPKTMAAVLKGGAALAGKKLPDTTALAQAMSVKAEYDKLSNKAAKPAKAASAGGTLPSKGRSETQTGSTSRSKVSPLLVLGGAAVAGLGVAMVLKSRKK